MIIECPKCSAKNRIPDYYDANRSYRCGNCKTNLIDSLQTTIVEDRMDDVQLDTGVKGEARSLIKNAKILRPISIVFPEWLKLREYHIVFLLAILTLLLHLFVLPYWDSPYSDEEHYIPEARLIIQEAELTNTEHPSLGKLFIAAGIVTIGDNPWGWRIPSTIFAIISVIVFYFIARKLAGRQVAVIASFLIIFESLVFVHSGLAMLDVFALMFMLLAFLLYLHDRYILTGISLALSALCKMTGLLGILVILAHWLIVRRKSQSPITIGLLLVFAFVAFLGLMPVFDFAAERDWSNPFARTSEMLFRHQSLTTEELTAGQLSDISYPWEWILSPIGHLSGSPGGAITLINPTIWIMILPSVGYMLYLYVKRRSEIALFTLLWFGSTYLLWIPLVLVTDRQTYLFYFYPTVGAVCLSVGYALYRFWNAASSGKFSDQRILIRSSIVGYLIIHVLLFIFLAPIMKALDYYIPFLPQGS